MSFDVKEHIIPAQHIRELPDALAIDETSSDATLQLHIKQYIPKNNPNPRPGDLTILAFHGNGFCKETYEPIWNHLLTSLPPNKRIRSIWIADVAQQGSSYLLNESKLGVGFAWDDHARDVLHMVNHFRNEMPPPILGIGHSMGTVVMVKLATFHPRLFHSVTLIEPWFYTAEDTQPISSAKTLKPALLRKDVFTNPDVTRDKIRGNPLFSTWDPHCLEIYLSHLLRPLPTVLHPDHVSSDTKSNTAISTPTSQPTRFTLRTPKAVEAHSLNHPNHHSLNTTPTASRLERLAMPYMSYTSPARAPVSNPTTRDVVSCLPSLRPRCLFLYGSTSYLSTGPMSQADRKRNLETTGVDAGGSGGVKLGCVSDEVMTGGHLFPFEIPGALGQRLARWAVDEGEVWWREKAELEELLWKGKDTVRERQGFDPEFVEVVKGWDGVPWSEEVMGKRRENVRAKL